MSRTCAVCYGAIPEGAPALDGHTALCAEVVRRDLRAELSAALVRADELTAQRDAFGQKATHLQAQLTSARDALGALRAVVRAYLVHRSVDPGEWDERVHVGSAQLTAALDAADRGGG
jgi:hypothetical protein